MTKKCDDVEGKSKRLHEGRALKVVFANEIKERPLRVDEIVAQNVFVITENGAKRFVIGSGESEKDKDQN